VYEVPISESSERREKYGRRLWVSQFVSKLEDGLLGDP
jgi:hypothetical protein